MTLLSVCQHRTRLLGRTRIVLYTTLSTLVHRKQELMV
jgi:hypothetical protein